MSLKKSGFLYLLLMAIFNQSFYVAAKDYDEDPVNPQSGRQTLSQHFDVTAKITNGCEFDRATYNLDLIPDSAGNQASADPQKVSVNCTLGSHLTLSVDNGRNSGNTGQRRLKNVNSNDYIPYTLTLSESSNASDGNIRLIHQFSNSSPYSFYISASADITHSRAGIYQDTVTFTTTF